MKFERKGRIITCISNGEHYKYDTINLAKKASRKLKQEGHKVKKIR